MTIGASNAVCTVCKRPKDRLHKRKSKLIPNMQMFLCEACYSGRKEPRFAIILVARSDGPAAVRDYVKNHRYIGDPIHLDDLI